MFNKTGLNSNLMLKVAVATGLVSISLHSLPAISQTTTIPATSGFDNSSTLTNQNAIPTSNLQGFSSLINAVPNNNPGIAVNGVSNISAPSFINGVPVSGTTNNLSNITNTNLGTTTGNNLNTVNGVAQANGLNTGLPQLSTVGGVQTGGVIPQSGGTIPQINPLGTVASPIGTTNVGGVTQGSGFTTGNTLQPTNVGGLTPGITIPQINGTLTQIGTLTNATGSTNTGGVTQGTGFITGNTLQPTNVGGLTPSINIPQINGTLTQINPVGNVGTNFANPANTTTVNGGNNF